jgi:hypothetical protein
MRSLAWLTVLVGALAVARYSTMYQARTSQQGCGQVLQLHRSNTSLPAQYRPTF